MTTLTCLCCGHSQDFADLQEAYTQGWDTPGCFPIAPLCDLCPTTLYAKLEGGLLVLPGPGEQPAHAAVHARWAATGRPHHFTIPSCT